MPIYDYSCQPCKKKVDVLIKWDLKDTVRCSECGELMLRHIPLISKTAGRWGDTGGGWDKSLGRHFNNSMEKEKYIKDNGLVSSSDIGGKGAVDDLVHKQIVDTDNHIKDVATYERIKKETGSVERALAETFSVDNMKGKGLLDSDINSGL